MKDPWIRMNKLNQRFGLTQALKNVSATVGNGEIVGLIGRNGAGKSTLLEVLAGLIVPDDGCSQLMGHDSRRLPDSVREQLGFVFQDDELFGWIKVADHIDEVGAHYRNWDRQRALELAERWSIPLYQRVSSLSRGQRQKLAILLAIVHQPTILLLDEPASALDPVSRRAFLAELVELACDGERTMVLSSHLLGDIERLADRIWLMKDGELVIDEPLDELKGSVLRLAFRGQGAASLPELPKLISQKEDEWGTMVVARHPGADELRELENRFGPSLQVSALNLEQIALGRLSMEAGLKLSLPLLRVTMRWQTWLIMLMAVALALVTDSHDIGLAASGGAAAMLVIAAALGLTLRRCRSRGLARTLPGFTRTAVFAIAVVPGVLALPASGRVIRCGWCG